MSSYCHVRCPRLGFFLNFKSYAIDRGQFALDIFKKQKKLDKDCWLESLKMFQGAKFFV